MQTSNPTGEDRHCPVCGSSSQTSFAKERIDPQRIGDFTYASRKHPEFMCLRLVRCLACDLVYAPQPPAPGFLSAAYAEAAYDSGPEAHAAAESYAKALAPFMARLSSRRAAVDVGAGCGALLPWLGANGFDPVIGIEPSRAAIDAAPPEVRPLLREGMFSEKMLAGIRPSFMCSFMTLEHLHDPRDFVQTAHNLLEQGGILAVIVHNWRAPLNRLLGLRSPIIDVEHLQLFSPQAVKTLLARVGFASIMVQPIGNRYPFRYWLRLSPLPAATKSWIAAILPAKLINKPLSLRVGNLLAVGSKK